MSFAKAKGQADTLRLALKNATQVVNKRGVLLKEIREALGPLLTFEWDTSVLRISGTKGVNDFLKLLRNSILPRKDYEVLASMVKGSMREVMERIPPHWDVWAGCIRKYRVHTHVSWDDLIETVSALRTHDIDTPWDLAGVPKPRIESLALMNKKTERLHILWQAAKCFIEENKPPGSDNRVYSDNDALDVVKSIRAEIIDNTPCAIEDRRLRGLLDLPPNFDRLTPMGKTNALALCGAPKHLLEEFMDNRAKLNLLRSVKGSLRSVASGIANYLRYCNTNNYRPFPPSTGTVRKWSSTFNPGKTYGLYVNHVRKAAILLNCDDNWITHEVRLIAKGLKNEQDKSFAFPNFIHSVDLFKIIEHEGMLSTFGMLAYLSYLFPPQSTLRDVAAPGRRRP